MRRLRLIVACLLLVPVILLAVEQETIMPETDFNALRTPGRHVMSIRIDDHDRRFIFITPTHPKAGENLPIIFFFHGAGGSALQAERTYGWAEKAEVEHFFAVFPEGLPVRPDGVASFLLNPHIWRDLRPGNQIRGVDDLHFFEVLLTKIEEVMPVDTKRVYLTGFSNGAGMSFTLGAQFADRVAAIAPVSSQSFTPVESIVRAVPVYYLTGTADPLVPYYGGSAKLPWGNTRTTAPVQESIDRWVKFDGCPALPQVISDENGVRVLRYGPGRDNAEVLFTTVEGNGHHWPGTIEPLPKAFSGPTLDPFLATDRIWDFFVKHPMR